MTRTVGQRWRGLAMRRPAGSEVVVPLRRAWVVRRVLGGVTSACLAILAVEALIGWLLDAVAGHPLLWAVAGACFGAVPTALLVGALVVRARAAVAAGPGWVGVRFAGPWRRLDLGRVQTVTGRGDGGGSVAGGFFGTGPFGGGFLFGGLPAARPPGAGGGGLVTFEDEHGRRLDLDLGLFDAPARQAISSGLAPGAVLDPEAGRLLGHGEPAGDAPSAPGGGEVLDVEAVEPAAGDAGDDGAPGSS